jgi:hypothetical protein
VAIYTDSKSGIGDMVPDNAVATEWSRYEPLIKAEKVRNKYLFGIPLKVPQTKQEMNDDLIDDFIQDAVAELEAELKINIFPTQIDERYPMDIHEYQAMGYFRLRQRPVSSIESLMVTSSNEQNLWQIDNSWIDTGYLHQGLIYIVPLNIAVSVQSQGIVGGAGGAAFLAILGSQPWIPAYWRIKYTTGFKDGKLPRLINVLIGTQAAIDILHKMAQANAKSGSKSLSIDSLSQSNSNPGPDVYKTAIEGLEAKKALLVGRVRNMFGTKIISGNL